MTAATEFISENAQKEYRDADSFFIDYHRFQRDAKDAKQQKNDFQEGKAYVPAYFYPELVQLHAPNEDNETHEHIKSRTYEAILELEANKDSGVLSEDEYELAAGAHESYLKKMMLVEATDRMRVAGGSSEQETARKEFNDLNYELFGDIDKQEFDGIMTTEQKRVHDFVAQDEAGVNIKTELESYFSGKNFNVEEKPLLDETTLQALHEVLLEKFHDMLSAVPETDDETCYDLNACLFIINQSLEQSGLTAKGWQCVEDPSVSGVSSEVDKKVIKLPSDTRRTASQLRRLIVHETAVHTHRGQNGEDNGINLLKFGTANYGDVEEGQGVLFECAVASSLDNPSLERARDRYIVAGLALGADGPPRDARQTYELAWRLFAIRLSNDGECNENVITEAKKQAMLHIDNAYRGTNHAGPGVIYRKLKMYWEGLRKNADYYMAHADELPKAIDKSLVGKHDHTDESEDGESVRVHRLIERKTAA